ncbi:hypothetical protein AVEN_99394-1 [Araneus ventricosus]|uniref:Uncharacterized protein n=1 Tax=Araneus ventricosus TaxID=182803 RepID=A0A4Y2IM39_ARAVE|nr:hypothetical protein AVEN_99394-1 [Araneus ventricosus]
MKRFAHVHLDIICQASGVVIVLALTMIIRFYKVRSCSHVRHEAETVARLDWLDALPPRLIGYPAAVLHEISNASAAELVYLLQVSDRLDSCTRRNGCDQCPDYVASHVPLFRAVSPTFLRHSPCKESFRKDLET